MGTVGTYLSHGRLKTSYPAVFKLLNEIHAKRYESNLSHARIRRTQQPTKRIQFKWLAKGAAFLRRASDELATKFPAK